MNKTIYASDIFENTWTAPCVEYDYAFIAIGSDFRAYEALQKAQDLGVKIGKIILFEFDEREEAVASRKEFGAQDYSSLRYKQQRVKCSIKKASEALKNLTGCEQLSTSSSVIVDISCFTKPFFFTLLHWLKLNYQIPCVTVLYTEPKTYVFDKGLYSEYHSSSGPIRVEEIPSFNGNEANTDKNILVVMLGFDGDLSAEINEDIAPKKTFVVNGFPSYSPNFKDISLVANEKLVNSKNNELLYSRATNPFDTYNLLDKIKNENPSAFINVAPLGTKPMALGVCLFAIHNPDVRVVYPMPERFENITTSDSWCSWIYSIDLGDV